MVLLRHILALHDSVHNSMEILHRPCFVAAFLPQPGEMPPPFLPRLKPTVLAYQAAGS